MLRFDEFIDNEISTSVTVSLQKLSRISIKVQVTEKSVVLRKLCSDFICFLLVEFELRLEVSLGKIRVKVDYQMIEGMDEDIHG